MNSDAGPIMVTGRSGSGKTTLLLHFALKKSSETSKNRNKILVLTQSVLLSRTLSAKYVGLCDPAHKTTPPTTLANVTAAGSPPSLFDLPREHQAVFFSYAEFMKRLDSSLGAADGEYFFEENRTAASKRKSVLHVGDRLPRPHGLLAFSTEKEVGFRQFVDRYWQAIVNAAEGGGGAGAAGAGGGGTTTIGGTKLGGRRGNKHAGAGVRSGLPPLGPADAFRAILAVKGGDNIRTRAEQYSEKEQAFVDRALVVYSRLLLERREWDALDVAANLRKRCSRFARSFSSGVSEQNPQIAFPGCLGSRHYFGDSFSHILVDEAQDLLFSQISLLKRIGPSDSTAFVFVADTAQSIQLGRRFSFDRLKDLWFQPDDLSLDEEGWTSSSVEQSTAPEQQDDGSSSQKTIEKCEESNLNKQPIMKSRSANKVGDVHVLTQNFRTHAGLLKLNNALTEVMNVLFSNEMDLLLPAEWSSSAEKTFFLNETHLSRNSAFLLTNFTDKELVEGLVDSGGLGADQVGVVYS